MEKLTKLEEYKALLETPEAKRHWYPESVAFDALGLPRKMRILYEYHHMPWVTKHSTRVQRRLYYLGYSEEKLLGILKEKPRSLLELRGVGKVGLNLLLKHYGLPAYDKKAQCPHCGHPFTVKS
jgi:hypothetical protein